MSSGISGDGTWAIGLGSVQEEWGRGEERERECHNEGEVARGAERDGFQHQRRGDVRARLRRARKPCIPGRQWWRGLVNPEEWSA